MDEYDQFINPSLQSKRALSLSTAEQTYKSFFARLKELWTKSKVSWKVFITGIAPLTLSNLASGFNVAENISFRSEFSGVCGLTHKDVEATLDTICPAEAKMHIGTMKRLFNGYHFARSESVDPVYNTTTCLNFFRVRSQPFSIRI